MERLNRGTAAIALTALRAGTIGLGLLSSLAHAQPAPPDETIVVTGERETGYEVSTFLDRHLRTTRNGQLARWHEPVCVRTWGLPLAYNAFVSNRVMDMAERIGARTNRSELCVPNVRIGFTAEPQRMIDEVRRRFPIVLGFHYARQLDRLTQIRFPVQAWYATSSVNGSGEERFDDARFRAPGGGAGSRLSMGLSGRLTHVLILADARIVTGEDAASVADLIAFLALAQSTLADGCEPTPTILNLLDEECQADRRLSAMSRHDTAFLTALYAVNPELRPQSQRSALAARMHRELDGE
jgi:hypothetical protein